MSTTSDGPVVDRVRALVAPIMSDLGLDLYDCEFAGGVLRIAVDTLPGTEGGVDLDAIALVTRLVSRELDHSDPVPGRYTLEVTSPGLERSLRLPEHFKREIGKTITLRLHELVEGKRRVQGELTAADDRGITVKVDDADLAITYAQIDRARTVFVWGPAPKPGKAPSKGRKTTEAHA